MSHHGYQEVDHTGDLALRVWGEDFKILLEQAARGMYDLMGVSGQAESQIHDHFTLEEGSQETILVDFLNELVFLAEDQKYCFTKFHFKERPNGMDVSCQRNQIVSIKRNIKAVTFHNLAINQVKEGLSTIITFDV
jgi:SHS2 domain-containing protein